MFKCHIIFTCTQICTLTFFLRKLCLQVLYLPLQILNSCVRFSVASLGCRKKFNKF